MVRMTFAHADDWTGVYVGDKLISEGHRISAEDAVKIAIEHKVTDVSSAEVDYEWAHELGNLPVLLKDVKWMDGREA